MPTSAPKVFSVFNPQPYGDINVMRADGSDVRRLADNQYEEGTPSWRPCGKEQSRDQALIEAFLGAKPFMEIRRAMPSDVRKGSASPFRCF